MTTRDQRARASRARPATARCRGCTPYPDDLLDLPDPAPGPEAVVESREAMSLAFVTALQLLPPKQRAVLILRDVLGYRAAEAADILDTTVESVTSALKRARATLDSDESPGRARTQPPAPAAGSPEERRLIEAYVDAFTTHDVDKLVAILSEDVWLKMPPLPLEYHGRDAAIGFFQAVVHPRSRPLRLVHTRANGCPASGIYAHDPATGPGVRPVWSWWSLGRPDHRDHPLRGRRDGELRAAADPFLTGTAAGLAPRARARPSCHP